VNQLRRSLRPWDVVWLLVTAVVSVRWIAAAAAAGPSSLLAWPGAMLLFFLPLAFCVVSMSARYPEEGGLYVWSKHAFGDFAGFLSGWMYWMSTVIYFPGLLYIVAGSAIFVVDPSGRALAESPAYYIAASLLAMAIALGVNLLGFRYSKWLQNLGGFGAWMPVAVLIVMGVVCVARFGPVHSIHLADLVPRVTTSNLTFWSTIAFAFGGIEAAAFVSEEMHDSARTIRRAVLLAGAVIAAIYLLGTAAVLLALPGGAVGGQQGIMQALAGVAARVGWPGATPWFAALITLATLGGITAWLGATARLPFVAGVDRVLPPAFGRLHPRWGTPWLALMIEAAGAALLAVLGQAGASVQEAYNILVSLGVISFFIPYVFMFAAQLRLDRRWWARGLAALGLAVTMISIVLAAMPPPDSPRPWLASVKVIGASALLFALGAALYHRAQRSARAGSPAPT
jgi:glutamate:GABA antiporter